MARNDYQGRGYTIVSYNDDWKDHFANEARLLKSIFTDAALTVEHVGSTAVPGLAGKPTIDILITVIDITAVDAFNERMQHLGYKILGEYVMKNARLFAKEVDDTRLYNVHIFQQGHPHVQEMTHLRDHLRSHPKLVTEYSNLKFDLFSKYPDDYGRYRELKDIWMNNLKDQIKNNTQQTTAS